MRWGCSPIVLLFLPPMVILGTISHITRFYKEYILWPLLLYSPLPAIHIRVETRLVTRSSIIWKVIQIQHSALNVQSEYFNLRVRFKNVTGSGKTGLIATITDIHFLPVRESCTHALPRNTKYLIIDGHVCFYRRLFTDVVKPPGCISWP